MLFKRNNNKLSSKQTRYEVKDYNNENLYLYLSEVLRSAKDGARGNGRRGNGRFKKILID